MRRGLTTSTSDSVSQAICQLASALTPKAPVSSAAVASRVGDGQAKVIESRSKCYQLAELKNIMESGQLLEEEDTSERQVVMNTLHKLKGK